LPPQGSPACLAESPIPMASNVPGCFPGPADPPRSSEVMARLTLSVLQRGSAEPGFWAQPEVHRALLVSGLSLLVGSLVRLNSEGGEG
jgi:hypothetical protein